MKNKRFLRVVGMVILSTLFCVGCGDKIAGDEEPTYHTITLDADGGTVEPGSVTATQCAGCNWVSVSLPTPMRDGYTFKGWYTAKGGHGAEVGNQPLLVGDTTIYAHWTLTHYTITFDAHGGEVTPAHDTTGDDWKLASLPTPTRADHTFDGWYMDVVGVREKVTEANVYRADATLYAHWVYNSVHYTISFDANGGTVDPLTEETDVGGILQDLPTPEREGYAFTGWYTEKTGGTTVSTSTVFNSAQTVYAQWILITPKMYTVTFNAHGGIVTPKSGTTGEDGKLLVPLPTPTREGYAFMGWYTEDDKVTDNTVFRENTAIHATWNIIHYTVTFDATGGTVTPATAKTGPHWELDSLPTPKREGYTFVGWFTEETGGTRVFPKSMAFIGDVSVYAHWWNPPSLPSLVDARDGKAYKEVAIGEQIWMAENLNYDAPGSRCYDDDPANCETYGRLYDWNTAMVACPVEWHLPSDEEWTELLDFVGGVSESRKLASSEDWGRYPGTDDYGFTALASGAYDPTRGRFFYRGEGGSLWSASKPGDAVYSSMGFRGGGGMLWQIDDTPVMYGVRCLKD